MRRFARVIGFLVLVSGTAAGAAAPGEPAITGRVTIVLGAGVAQSHRIDLGSALSAGVVYTAELSEHTWSDGTIELGLRDLSPGGDGLETVPRAEIRRHQPVHLVAIARRCAAAATYGSELRLVPKAAGALLTSPPVAVPLTVTVRGSADPCRGESVAAVLRASLAGTLVFFLHSLVVSSHFLSRRELALRLRPLRREGPRNAPVLAAADVELMIAHELRLWRRALAWLRANPLRFALPGRAYYEAAELHLAAQEDASSLALQPHPDLYRALDTHPERGAGRLFVSARGGIRFFGVPQAGRLGGLSSRTPLAKVAKDVLRRVELRPGDRLYHDLENRDPRRRPEPGRTGWEF